MTQVQYPQVARLLQCNCQLQYCDNDMWPDLGKPTILSQLTLREIPI